MHKHPRAAPGSPFSRPRPCFNCFRGRKNLQSAGKGRHDAPLVASNHCFQAKKWQRCGSVVRPAGSLAATAQGDEPPPALRNCEQLIPKAARRDIRSKQRPSISLAEAERRTVGGHRVAAGLGEQSIETETDEPGDENEQF
jgi:hypothetical protein